MDAKVAAFELDLTEKLAKTLNSENQHFKVYFYSIGELMNAFSSDLEGDLNFV